MANELSNLHPAPGETKERMRVGRGEGSGKGKTAGRGTKGQQSRAGYKRRPNFEGGQTPLRRRIPKQGFTNNFANDFEVVDLGRLDVFEAGAVVDASALHDLRIISRVGRDGVKILGGGDVGVALHVRVAKLTRSASEKILAAGGTVEGPLPGE